MKLLRVHVISANTCGGLLDGLDLWMRSPEIDYTNFDPLCLVGPNGSGKSQFIQIIAEMFQCAFHSCASDEERIDSNPDLRFELEYLIKPEHEKKPIYVKVSRKSTSKSTKSVLIQIRNEDGWVNCDLDDPGTRKILPSKVIGYTSGENETLSLPFLVSRSGYADEVGGRALDEEVHEHPVVDTRMMLIDYGTHLEVFVANLLMGDEKQRRALLQEARLKDVHSFRCIVQLAHSAAPKAPSKRRQYSSRKGIQLTSELESFIDNLRRCATCSNYDEKTETYTFDYWINDQTRIGFGHFWKSTMDLYSSLHKLAMLNDLAIPKKSRDRLKKATKLRRFASRLPEPQDEDKVFRFERVSFSSKTRGEVVDYVSLSDGEHQLGQLLGTFCMLSFPNVLFLLDEPESHFNPHWRVKTISRILNLPTPNGARIDLSKSAEQECVITTHAPFVPSDMHRENVFMFQKEKGKVKVQNPDIETYGTTFDTILEECFGVRPPISSVSMEEIERLRKSDNPDEIKEGIERLGDSVEKVFLADRLRQLKNK